jgi:membrane associated rhomboid family serine protease
MLDKLQQGRTAARAGDIAEARRLLTTATQEAPDNIEAWLELTGVVESLEEKRACLNQVLALDPSHAAARTSLALIEQKQGAARTGVEASAGQSLTEIERPAKASTPLFDRPPLGVEASAGPGSGEADLSTKTAEVTPRYCYRHPQVETSLRCNRCNKPICLKCAQRTPVGFRCVECVLEIEDKYYINAKEGEINPFSHPLGKPLFSYILLGLIVIIWACMELAGGSTNSEVLIRFGANYGPLILEGEFWRLFSSTFLHIGYQHLIFNFIALVMFGFEMERIYGHDRYLIIYFLSGLFGSLLSFAVNGPTQFSAGASGAIFGLIGLNLAFFFYYRRRLGEYARQRRKTILVLIGINLLLGYTVMPVDNMAHIGGLVAGFGLGYGLTPSYRVDLTTSPRRIIDRASLLKRWWVPILGIAVLGGGLWSAQVFWSSLA